MTKQDPFHGIAPPGAVNVGHIHVAGVRLGDCPGCHPEPAVAGDGPTFAPQSENTKRDQAERLLAWVRTGALVTRAARELEAANKAHAAALGEHLAREGELTRHPAVLGLGRARPARVFLLDVDGVSISILARRGENALVTLEILPLESLERAAVPIHDSMG